MAWASSTCTTCSYSFTSASLMLLLLLLLGLSSQSCYGLETFGLDIHHRFSDTIKEILGTDGLPEKGSINNIPVAAEYKRVDDNFKAKRGIPMPPVAATPAIVAAVRIIMLMEFRRRVFQLSRCSPMLACISTLSATASKMA
ncbi:hypothetical protein CFP56_000785 [Quercus suber]|uniref:Uncharacterized protein n=1 Tax=Quercus suber TaxID=58331 RepID=A0AAW0INQ2_QUESU